MRKVIASLVIGTVLVLGVMVLLSTTMKAAPDMKSGGPNHRALIDQPIEQSDSPIGMVGRPRPGKLIKFRGTIDQLPTGTLTGTWTIIDELNQPRTVSVTVETRIVPPTIQPQVGDWVQVLARSDSNNPNVFVARLIVVKAMGPGPARPVEIHGEIQALPVPTNTATGTQRYLGEWVVSGFTVTVDSRTMIHPRKRAPTVGMRANIIAFEQDDGTLWAKNIALHALDSDAEVEFEGIIQSLPSGGNVGTWVVDGISVTVAQTTTLKGAPPAVGRMAEVKGHRLSTSSVAATEITVKGPGHVKVEVEGTLVATDTIPGEWLIDTGTEEISVTVETSTTIIPPNASVEIGVWVEVKALEQPDGSLVAFLIKIESDDNGPPGQQDADFTGTIEDLPPAAPHSFNGPWIVKSGGDSITVLVTGSTQITGDPQVGLTATVKGVWQNNGSVRAESIDVQ